MHTLTPGPTPPPPAAPPLTSRRKRWPIFAGLLSALLVIGVLAATLLSGGRGYGPLAGGPDDIALEMAITDAGGLGDLADGSTDPSAAPAAPSAAPAAPSAAPAAPGLPGRGHRGEGLGRLGDDSLLVGSVTAAGGGKLTVTRDGGGEVTVTTTDKTRVRGRDNKAVGDLKAGERVVIRVGTDKNAIGVLVLRPHVAGTVTALDGTKATITRPNGLTQAVDVTGLSEKPKVGDLIAVVGTSANNGATLKADKIKQLSKAG